MKTTLRQTRIASLHYEITLEPCSGGFGEWQRHPNALSASDGYSLASDILSQIDDECWELGEPDCPTDIDDIRGRIHHEPQAVYVVRHNDGTVGYFGIDTMDTYVDADDGEGVAIVRGHGDDGLLEERGYAMPQ